MQATSNNNYPKKPEWLRVKVGDSKTRSMGSPVKGW